MENTIYVRLSLSILARLEWPVANPREDFSNVVKKSYLERLAEADDHEIVRVVQEHFADYLVINPDLFSVGLRRRLWPSSPNTWDTDALTRSSEAILAVLLSLKKLPVIRYEKNSAVAKKLAAEVGYRISKEGQLFEFGRRADTPPVLLILDRRNDPFTPLLTQWTYQAMVHELLGINNGRVDLSEVPDVRPELKVGAQIISLCFIFLPMDV